MKIAVASGKGGTGKTTVAVALALALSETEPVTLLDCDVEAPNARLFLRLSEGVRSDVAVRVPQVDKSRCTACGECARVCQFNAIAAVPSGAMVFPELCHACGGCTLFCPQNAIVEVERTVGQTSRSTAGKLSFVEGRTNIGEAMSTPTIRAVKALAAEDDVTILDCPPGTACPMVAAVRGADFVLLVTEPTPFGINDLRLAIETVQRLGLPAGVVVNRAGAGGELVRACCEEYGLPVLLEIPESRAVAESYAGGLPLTESLPQMRQVLRDLGARIRRMSAAGSAMVERGTA